MKVYSNAVYISLRPLQTQLLVRRLFIFLKNFFSQVESEIQVESSLYFGSVTQVESSLHFGSVIQVESSVYFGSVTQVESSLYFGTVIQVDSTLYLGV